MTLLGTLTGRLKCLDLGGSTAARIVYLRERPYCVPHLVRHPHATRWRRRLRHYTYELTPPDMTWLLSSLREEAKAIRAVEEGNLWAFNYYRDYARLEGLQTKARWVPFDPPWTAEELYALDAQP